MDKSRISFPQNVLDGSRRRWCRLCRLWLPAAQFPPGKGHVCQGCLPRKGAATKQRPPWSVDAVTARVTPGAQAYRAWIDQIESRFKDLPSEWQRVWRQLDRPNLHAMAAALGKHEEAFRRRWMKRGLPKPPRANGLIKL